MAESLTLRALEAKWREESRQQEVAVKTQHREPMTETEAAFMSGHAVNRLECADELAATLTALEREPMQREPETDGRYLFTDVHGSVWRLRATYEPSYPFIFELVECPRADRDREE